MLEDGSFYPDYCSYIAWFEMIDHSSINATATCMACQEFLGLSRSMGDFGDFFLKSKAPQFRFEVVISTSANAA